MRWRAAILLFVAIVALFPLRGIAGAASDLCGAGQEQFAAAQTADVHCPASVVLPAASPAALPARSSERSAASATPVAVTFFPDPLDPPPLSALR